MKLKSSVKVILFVFIYSFIIQFSLGHVAPTKAVYNYRMEYDFIKDNPSNLVVVLEHMKREIHKKENHDYVVILGDSVEYSSPGKATESIGYYMQLQYETLKKDIDVYNLALPSNQMGDIYTLLLELDRYGISRDHVIIGVMYSGFTVRNPDPSPVFWFYEPLKEEDGEAYAVVEDSLKLNGKVSLNRLSDAKNILLDKIAIIKYKDTFRADMLKALGMYKTSYENEISQNWRAKPYLGELLKQPLYQRFFSDEAFIMNDSNPQLYFLDKIIELQSGHQTLFILSDVNHELLKEETSKDGYKENVKRIEAYFKAQNVQYLDLENQFNVELFSDHVHLIPEGYEVMAQTLMDEIEDWFE